jgi:hypothetical protein
MIDNYLNKIQEKFDVKLQPPDDWNIDLKLPELDWKWYHDPKIQKMFQNIFGPYHYSQPGTKKLIAGGAIALLIIAAAALVYRKFMSKAAKECRKYKGDEKNECLKRYREKAKQLKIKTLMQNKKECSKTKNPQKCVEKINKKLISLRGNK